MAGQRGYTRMGVERARTSTTPDLKEFWHVGREWQPSHPRAARYPRNVWPREIEGFREAMLDLFQALEGLGERLLQALAIYLEVADDYFGERSRGGDSILRAIHYPPLTLPTEGVRAAAHEDINLITLLVGAEEPGLQLQTRSGRWLEVPSHPDQVIVNVGDMLQRMTNGVLPSTRHRVINPEAERCSQSRYSMPFFLHLRGDCRLDPVPSCVSEGRPRLLLESITAAEYLWQRLREIGLTTEAGPPSSATSPGSSPS
jgi:isopenicillin N synthase-like dioxygenase